MSNLNLFNQSWNEIVFEGRNKNYGAYQLRQENPQTTLKALLIGTLFCALFVSIPLLASFLKNGELPIITNPNTLPPQQIIKIDNPPLTIVPIVPAGGDLEKSSAKQTKFTPPTITDTHSVTTEAPVLNLDKPIKTGSTDNIGNQDGNVAIGESNTNGTGTVANFNGSGTGETDAIVSNIGLEKSPEFPGGIQNFMNEVGVKFRTPDIYESGIKKIFVSFVVEKDGSLSNIKVVRDPGFGLGNEAIRVLKSIKTKWNPGIQNGKKVRVSYNLPISVVIKN